jgi:hypothetical protein
MTRSRMMRLSLVILVLAFLARAAQAQIGAVVSNWAVPSSSSSSSSGLHHSQALGDVTRMLPFVGVTPCRIVDTRGPAGLFGAPSLPASSPRSFTLPAGPCAGIPAGVAAYSLNITVTNTLGPGFISLYPTGGSAPLVSTLNYVAGQTIANAAVVPAGTGGAITAVAGVSGTDLIIDINGYFSQAPNSSAGYFGVVFDYPLGGGVIFGQNTEPTALAYGGNFLSASTGNGSAGVHGASSAASGITYGVLGTNSSTSGEASGVKGVDATGDPTATVTGVGIGVLGTSTTGFGVLGRSQAFAVDGKLYNGSGAFLVEGLLGTTFGTAADATTGPWAVFAGGNFGASGTKHFVEPHPTDPKKVILYSAIEGRTVDTYFRGTARVVGREAVIEVPEDFRIVTDEDGLTVQLTPVGGFASMYVESQDLNRIVVKSSKDLQFHYLVQGVRRAFKDFQPVQTGYEFMPRSSQDSMPPYLTEEAKRRLISNGTYNADGTVNMQTAERAGWTKIWADQAAKTQAAAQKAKESSAK